MQPKQRYLHQMGERLGELEEEIQRLRQRTRQVSVQAKEDLREHLDDLDRKRRRFTDKIRELETAQANQWQEVRSTVDWAWDRLQQAYENTASEI